MQEPIIHDKKLATAQCQFIFPFSIKPNKHQELRAQLKKDEYQSFYLSQVDYEKAFYGEGYRVSHRSLERHYLPFTSSFLFPKREDDEGFHRYTRKMGIDVNFRSGSHNFTFRIHSVDMIVCPFDLGLMTIRTEIIADDLTYTQALDFAAQLRVLENLTDNREQSSVSYAGQEFKEVEDFVFKVLAKSILPYLDTEGVEGAYFETLPFFVDERMYVQGFFAFEEDATIENIDLYRAAHLDGVSHKGEPFVSAANNDYIDNYCSSDRVYKRWAPYTHYVTAEHAFCCLTNRGPEECQRLANQMYGEYYYTVLLNLFHHIVLLKLSNRHSDVRVDKDNREIEYLIRSITDFSTRYYFIEVISQSQGKDIFLQLRNQFGNDRLFEDVEQTLSSLYQYQEKFSDKRHNHLLMILTIYTVISGIFGMNLVIDDLKGGIQWKKFLSYGFFDYIALFVTFTGIIVAFTLGVTALVKWISDKRNVHR
ncbi:hypothetical protein PP175_20555 [Aneurinibacillus sp. Ricciae_BoGa-3]|uniref:hypothetical protein n=1 Tax=Aneurinibacillus sp. Ricciae_BoGa-3 TaxID=3022697 RepID=UPI002341F2DE|nr:hypothetical protein [Aneurinibacillus sp. Ricciae_BoGa-3]WCK53697.1 hypothetical protein PP175_20555 [Aneurinibacillus sp. Ricciae_BoGa-3]